MKIASTGTATNLATGKAVRVDLYAITLAGGASSIYLTTGQLPAIVGGQVYSTGIVFNRNSTRQEAGMKVQSMKITATPQPDASGGQVYIGGLPFLQACANRLLDGARILYSKCFLAAPDSNGLLDYSVGALPWFQGRVNTVVVQRDHADITVNSDVEMLNVQMPINIFQPSCLHTLFDSGCGLSAATFTDSGAVAGGSTQTGITSSLNKADDYYTLGKIVFTSGPNVGITRYVKQYKNSSGVFLFNRPLPYAPVVGDNFLATAGCKHTMAACSNTSTTVGPAFNNLARFRGYPFIPVPETTYDGGTTQTTNTTIGSQGGAKVGSRFSSKV